MVGEEGEKKSKKKVKIAASGALVKRVGFTRREKE